MLATIEHIDSKTPHALSTPIDAVPDGKTKGEEKPNRNTPEFKNRFNSMKPKEKRFSNRNKKCSFLLRSPLVNFWSRGCQTSIEMSPFLPH